MKKQPIGLLLALPPSLFPHSVISRFSSSLIPAFKPPPLAAVLTSEVCQREEAEYHPLCHFPRPLLCFFSLITMKILTRTHQDYNIQASIHSASAT